MLSKETKIRILENFYALDYLFFGKQVKDTSNACPICVEEYVTLKGALLSTIFEMYKLIDHTPTTLSEKIDTVNLMTSAKQSAILARSNAENLVKTEACRNEIKNKVKSIIKEDTSQSIDDNIKHHIREKALELAVDNLLIARALTESQEINKLNDWSGRLIEDAYKVLRSNLVESANDIISME